MRKLITFLVGLLLAGAATTAKAQTVLTEGTLNEVKINLPLALAGSIDLSYERILLEDLSLGASGSVAWSKSYPYRYSVMPYARWFFWKHRGQDAYPGAGFFIEVNSGFFSATGEKNYGYNEGGSLHIETKTAQEFGAGLGLGIGWKWISKSGFVGEIFTGGGRNFVPASKDMVPAYFRAGISLGYRF